MAPSRSATLEPTELLRTPRWRRIVLRSRKAFYGMANAFPFRMRGLLASGFVSWIWFGTASLEHDLVLRAWVWATAVLLAYSFVVIVVAATFLRFYTQRQLERPQLEAEESETRATGRTIPRLTLWPLLSIHMEAQNSDGDFFSIELKARGWQLHEVLTAERRGYASMLQRYLVVEDLLGLCRMRFALNDKIPVQALPFRGRFRGARLPESILDGEDQSDPHGSHRGDRVEFRAYAPGDPIRFMAWKTFARTGKATVRTPERAVSQERKLTVVAQSSALDDAAFGWLRSICDAQFPSKAFELHSFHHGPIQSRSALQKVLSQRPERPGSEQARTAKDSQHLHLQRLIGDLKGAGDVLWVAGCEPKEWLDAALAFAARHGRLRVLLAFDSIDSASKTSSGNKRIALSSKAIDEAAEALDRVGAELWLADRQSGSLQQRNTSLRARSRAFKSPRSA